MSSKLLPKYGYTGKQDNTIFLGDTKKYFEEGRRLGAVAELKDELAWLNRSLEWAYVFAKGETQQIFQMRKDKIEKRLRELKGKGELQ